MNPDEAEKAAVMEFFHGRKDGYFVEVGINDPRENSQTWRFEQLGWTGLLVEPMRAHYDNLVQARPHSRVERAACVSPNQCGEGKLQLAQYTGHNTLRRHVDDFNISYVGEETVQLMTLNDLLEKQPPARVDFISIDVEGTELDVLRGFNLARWQPQLILIEDKVNNLEKHNYLSAHGYRLLRRTTLNGWYVPIDSVARNTLAERWQLLRKYYLGLPFRRLQHWRRSRRIARHA